MAAISQRWYRFVPFTGSSLDRGQKKVMMKIDEEEDPEVKSFLEGTLNKKVIAAKKLIDKPVK